jgi:glyoxylase-like metal-dependent hydrolase (beta-lactamase superfamily II)
MRKLLIAVALMVGGAACAGAEPFHLIPGAVPMDKGPDGNTVILDAPKGLVVFDTGRHPEHAQAILHYAKQRRRPIAAIVNSHWHLDHTTGNWDIRRAYPHVAVYASNALEGALATYLKQGREQGDKVLADPKTPAAQKAELLRGRAVVDHPERIRPNHVVSRSARMRIAGRWFDVHLSRFAASEGDVWLYDRKTRTLLAGDLVVGIVPFLDTACAEGWAKALGEIDRVPFVTLVPGHGDPMTRADFRQWRLAYGNLLDCAQGPSEKSACIAGWQADAAKFIDGAHREYVGQALAHYIDRRLRAADEQALYCKPLLPKT